MHRYRFWVTAVTTAVFAVLAFSIPLWSLEVYLYGSLSTPEVKPPEGVSYTVDLGDHAFSAADWETLLRRQEKVVLFPSLKDLETYRAFLSDRKEQVIVSDFYKDEKSPYKTFFTLNENYHTFIFLNFVTDEVSIPWEALQEDLRNQNPDALLVVGNSKNMATLQEKLSSFSATQFINRDAVGESFTRFLPLPEKEVFLFFYSSRCPVCRKLKNEVTPPAFAPYRDRIKVVYLDYTITANYEELIRLEEFWKVEEKSSVEIFSAAGYVASEDEASINKELEALIQKTLTLEEGKKKVIPTEGEAKGLITSRFQGFTPWVLVGAGLLDGLNPCAFATIIFMVNLLLVLGQNRRRIFQVGATYASAVFVTYLLLGVGIFEVWRSLSVYQMISRIVYGVMAGVLMVLAVLSLKDAFQYRKEGKDTEMTLGLPKGWRVKINQYLKESFTNRSFFLAAILSGFVISIVEAGCTGQVYLPTIMYIAREVQQYRLRALGYLLFYNAFFIVPLLLVFLGIFFGSQSRALVNFGRKNVFVSKIALAGLFVILGVLLLEGALT
jgi:thiol-disulfide isomerase/thioredoxin